MEDKNKNNYLWIGVAVVAVIVIAIIFISNSNKTPIQEEEFILNDDNFELLSLSHHPQTVGVATTLDGVCSRYKEYLDGVSLYDWKEDYQKNEFVISYNIKGASEGYLDEPLSCYILVDNIKYYAGLYEAGAQEIRSSRFCDNPHYGGEVGETCWYARADITKSNSISFCCEGICKTKTLPAYC